MAKFDVTSNHSAPGDQFFDAMDLAKPRNEVATAPAHVLDGIEARKVHRQLLQWFYYEREKQSANRLEMAMDADFYDNLQWDPEDAAEVTSRGQMPLVYNEVAPMADWIMGTERRSRVDWKVLPRTEDDVKAADIKTKVLKYVSDVNRTAFVRSRAFGDAIKAGIGWVDDGARDDPTKDILYSKYEDWRRVLHDSGAYELDLEDGRYLFRWRWVDEDVALFMFPDRKNQIMRAVSEATQNSDISWEEQNWNTENIANVRMSGQIYASGTGMTVDAKRRQLKLIECQYRMPVKTRVVASGPLKGAVFDERDPVMREALGSVGGSIVDKIIMRMHTAVFTETDMLGMGPSIYRHNKFSLTPFWCYLRGRDRMPYGVIRRVRDVQQDLNKRASKALFMLNTNQIIMDKGAVDDPNEARDEVDRPDGVIVKNAGKEFDIRRDTDAATGQIQMMTLAAQSIQKSAGVAQENMGRQTNAVSGEAIKARQMQGSVVTTEPFDNLRFSVQVQGEKQLSLSEQFYSEEKVIRLTGAKGAIEWVIINKPELQPDGSVRFINDITNSMADFVVAEQDYSGTLRQVMFESLSQMSSRLPPEVSLRVLTIAMEFSDLPNKDEIAEQLRKLTGDRDPNKEMTPEEMQQLEQQMQQQAEAMEIQRQTALTALEEQRAKVRQINAQAAKMEAEAGTAGQGLPPEVEREMRQVQERAATEIDRLSQALAKSQQEALNKTLEINKNADIKVETARITADATVRAAEIQAASDKKLEPLLRKMEDLARQVAEAQAVADEANKRAEKIEKAPPPEPAPAPAPAPVEPAAPAAPPAPMTINVNVDAKQGKVTKSIVVDRDADGAMKGAEVTITPDEDPAPAKGKTND